MPHVTTYASPLGSTSAHDQIDNDDHSSCTRTQSVRLRKYCQPLANKLLRYGLPRVQQLGLPCRHDCAPKSRSADTHGQLSTRVTAAIVALGGVQGSNREIGKSWGWLTTYACSTRPRLQERNPHESWSFDYCKCSQAGGHDIEQLADSTQLRRTGSSASLHSAATPLGRMTQGHVTRDGVCARIASR